MTFADGAQGRKARVERIQLLFQWGNMFCPHGEQVVWDSSHDEMPPSSFTQLLVAGRREPGQRHPRGPGAVRAVAADRDISPRDGLQHTALALL